MQAKLETIDEAIDVGVTFEQANVGERVHMACHI